MWRKLPTTNLIERCFAEVRRRTRPTVCFVAAASVDPFVFSVHQRYTAGWGNRTLSLFSKAAGHYPAGCPGLTL